MTPPSFHCLVDDYLRVRRGLGFDLESTEWKLREFATYADRIGHRGAVTIELAVEWAQSSRSSNPAQAVRRLAAVRQFARHRALFDPATEVPPVGLLGRIPRRLRWSRLCGAPHRRDHLRPRTSSRTGRSTR